MVIAKNTILLEKKEVREREYIKHTYRVARSM